MFLFMGLCLGLSAFGLLGGAVWAYLKQQRTMQDRVAATGTVTGIDTEEHNQCPWLHSLSGG